GIPGKRRGGLHHRHGSAGGRRLDRALSQRKSGREIMDQHSTKVATLADACRLEKPKDRQIVLVLQGGGALGAYQAGVYHALHEHGIEPDWIIGTSIGAINASLIGGNPPAERLDKLKEFWTRMAYRPPFAVPAWTGLSDTIAYWKTLLRGIPAFFEPNPGAFLVSQVPAGTE